MLIVRWKRSEVEEPRQCPVDLDLWKAQEPVLRCRQAAVPSLSLSLSALSKLLVITTLSPTPHLILTLPPPSRKLSISSVPRSSPTGTLIASGTIFMAHEGTVFPTCFSTRTRKPVRHFSLNCVTETNYETRCWTWIIFCWERGWSLGTSPMEKESSDRKVPSWQPTRENPR